MTNIGEAVHAVPKDAGSIPGHDGCFSGGVEKHKCPCVKILVHVKFPRLPNINPEPSILLLWCGKRTNL